MIRHAIIASAYSLLLAATAFGNEDPAAQLSQVIDRLVEDRLRSESISVTEEIDDYAFARRVTLDLAGRVPTRNELTEFVAAKSLDKRDKRRVYVERLLAAPDFAYHLRNSLDAMLLARLTNDNDWRDYLLEATRENRSWDQIFREIMLPEHERPDDKGPAAFLRARARDVDSMTNDASVLLFGVNIACAKCHDHPFVGDWQQQHYFGLASFFQRTFPTRSGFVGEKFDGTLKFTTVEGEEHQAELMFLTGMSVPEPESSLDGSARKKVKEQIRDAQRNADAPLPPTPDFSPRAELVRLSLASDGTDYLSRNIVNRVWARLLGRGLVHPLDQMHSGNLASHPVLLETLSNDFVQHGYDLKRLIRGIVLTRTYARSSRWTAEAEPPGPELFARGIVRPLSPWQLALSLHLVTRHPDQTYGLWDSEDWDQMRGKLEKQSTAFASDLPIADDNFQVGIDEALMFSNSANFYDAFVKSGDGKLVSWLNRIDHDELLIDEAFLTVVSRPPTAAERGAIALHLAQRADRRTEAIEQIVWTLLASPEFRFNH